MDDDDFFDDGGQKGSSFSLLKNIVASDEQNYKSTTVQYSSVSSPAGIPSKGRKCNGKVPTYDEDDEEDDEDGDSNRASSGGSAGSEEMSPIARKPPLPPSEMSRLSNSLNISSTEYSLDNDDRCKNPELRLDLSHLSGATVTTKKQKKSFKAKGVSKKSHKLEENGYHRETTHNDRVKSKIQSHDSSKAKAFSGSSKHKSISKPKGKGNSHYYAAAEDDDTCSTCQSSTSSNASEEVHLDEPLSAHSDVTSVSPLNSPPSNYGRNYRQSAGLSKNSASSPAAADDLFRMMRRLIDDVEKKKSRHPTSTYSGTFASDRGSALNASWGGSSRHPTLGEIIQSLSKFQINKSSKSNSSKAPSVASGGATSNFSMSTTLSGASSKSKSAFEPQHRRTHASINRDKRQKEIAAENLRMYQRLQSVRASPALTRDRQMADWQRQISYGTVGTSGGSKHTSERPTMGVAPLSGLIASAGRGTRPARPQSAIAYLNTTVNGSVVGDVGRNHHRVSRQEHGIGGSRPSSGSYYRQPIHEGNGHRLDTFDEHYEYQLPGMTKKKKKSRPISGHF